MRTVLDHGFVRLLDTMPAYNSGITMDQAVVMAARVSYGSGLKGEYKDAKLIKYLWDNQHGSPFEMAVFKFHIKCPIFVARQWVRHRMSSYNEVSARYREVPNEYYEPEIWRSQDDKNKQGSGGEISDNVIFDDQTMTFSEMYKYVSDQCFAAYETLIGAGVARELARSILPVSTYTEFYWKVNARSLLNFLQQRADEHAQFEIREYALGIKDIFRTSMPYTYTAVWGDSEDQRAANVLRIAHIAMDMIPSNIKLTRESLRERLSMHEKYNTVVVDDESFDSAISFLIENGVIAYKDGQFLVKKKSS